MHEAVAEDHRADLVLFEFRFVDLEMFAHRGGGACGRKPFGIRLQDREQRGPDLPAKLLERAARSDGE